MSSKFAALLLTAAVATAAQSQESVNPRSSDPAPKLAAGDEAAWVVSGSVGRTAAPGEVDVSIRLGGGPVPISTQGKVRYGAGEAASLSLARQFEGWSSDEGRRRHPWRLELEGLKANVKREVFAAGVASARLNDSVSVDGLLVNGLVRLARTDSTHWWLGAGWGRLSVSLPEATAALPGCACLRGAQADVSTWRLKARGEWTLIGDTALFIEVSQLRLPAIQAGTSPGVVTTYGATPIRTLGLGLRLSF